MVERAKAVSRTEQQLVQRGTKPILSAADIASVNAQLAQIDTLLASRQLEQTQAPLSVLKTNIAQLQERQLSSQRPVNGLESNALALSYDRLGDLASHNKTYETLRGGDNQLPGGDFESLGEMTQYGWQNIVQANAGAATEVQLSAVEPRHGAYSLELRSAPPPGSPPNALTDPLVWVVSPGIPLEAGKLVEISGWVRVDQPFVSPSGGLAIVDTLGGPELSLVVRETSGWQTFRIVRAVPKTSELRVTFALTSYGSARVDAVMMRTLDEPIARRLPAVSDSAASPATAGAPSPTTAPLQQR
jgi:hypothetical protein